MAKKRHKTNYRKIYDQQVIKLLTAKSGNWQKEQIWQMMEK